MAGNEVTQRSRWILPGLVQETIAGLVVTLIVASLAGSLVLWRGFGIHDLRITEVEKDYKALVAWKEEFGKKKRFGEDDGDKLERQIVRLNLKVDALISTISAHNQVAERYIERIDADRRRIDVIEEFMKGHWSGGAHSPGGD